MTVVPVVTVVVTVVTVLTVVTALTVVTVVTVATGQCGGDVDSLFRYTGVQIGKFSNSFTSKRKTVYELSTVTYFFHFHESQPYSQSFQHETTSEMMYSISKKALSLLRPDKGSR
jgi:hypothetical protein